jgi:anion-transporting  ArsA/GET3 family ATPase
MHGLPSATLERMPASPVVPAILARDLVFVTGKGGVGKTTVAAALALAAADAGRDAIVCEVGGQSRIGPPLSSISIDPDAALVEWIARNAGRAAAAILGHSGTFEQLVAAAPGARELITLGKAWDLTRAGDERLVVVDAPASGHAVALLKAPSTYAQIVRAGPVGHQAASVREFFADPSASAIVLVSTPADLPVSETIELAGAIEDVTGRRVDAVIVNEVLPDRFADRDIAVLERHLRSDDPRLRTARHSWARAVTQREQLKRLHTASIAPLVELPFLFEAVIGPAQLAALAAALSDERQGELTRE